jgi:molybdopterin converting factor subunit 1
MRILVRLFAGLRDGAKTDAIDLRLDSSATAAAVRARVGELFPAVAPLVARSAIAINQQYADDTQVLRDGDEVAILPPVSGG